MKLTLTSTFLFIICLLIPTKIEALENPFSVENNKFGIHILSENDLDDAYNLVNSSGGDWGYVTMVIREDERDVKRWQKVFDKMRRLHLIPIIRTATKQKNDYWTKPSIDEISDWVIFFDSLNWVVKNRYIIVGNEPNHVREWGGNINPAEYGNYLVEFSKALKSSSDDYFILPAGLDLSAPNDNKHMTASLFLRLMIRKYPQIFDYVDGWSSHSYPNPNFSGSPDDIGMISVKGYQWELYYLRNLGIEKNLPVFITETGWAHKTDNQDQYLNPEELDNYYRKLYQIYLEDDRVVAFTPFLLSYDSEPFEIFSWKKSDKTFYSFFSETQKINKKAGSPIRINQADLIFEFLPQIVKEKDNNYYSVGIAKNSGQVIWRRNVNSLATEKKTGIMIEISPSVFSQVEPGEIGIIRYRKL